MNFTDQASAIAILIDYLAGFGLGVIGSAVLGSLREDRMTLKVKRELNPENSWLSLREQPPDPVSAGVRVMFGVFTRSSGYLPELPPEGRRRARDPREGNPFGSDEGRLDR